MKVLFIGGTGNISTPCSRLAIEKGIDLYHLNRGLTGVEIPKVKTIIGDINKPETLSELSRHTWDAVVNWIVFTPEEMQRDIELFKGKTKQYIFISSASCYQTPLSYPIITESTPIRNNVWEYSNNKIKCEELLMKAYREQDFPFTIVRPSFTYDTIIPIAIGGVKEYTTADRILKGQEIIIHGDGTSVWVTTHADDFAVGLVGLLGLTQAIGHTFHITSDEVLTWNSIYKILADSLGCELNAVHITSDFICSLEPGFTGDLLGDKTESVIFDNTKIKTFVPEFKATIPFATGIKRTLEWFQESEDRMFVNQETNKKIDHVLKSYQART
ncbi:NAD-dependent epimerase/dehydratase family protein [Muricauda sp. MAR_2010_75]|uniref:NAD-dependent epimerase/dehydratase family protein n=1 Tax=Allomuricauda sp. MAR_2010_75 TaxID=1250232 RepID=UPI000567DBD7|nr:NAD-dependent epimerase/dehydratase family protein [Muricauda sp. MAR_2010_75]